MRACAGLAQAIHRLRKASVRVHEVHREAAGRSGGRGMTTAPLDLFWHETDADRDTDERHSAMTLAEADARMDPLAHGRAAMQRDITEGPSALLKEQLCAIATELLLIAEKFGVTFSEVRLAAETRGLLTGHEYGRWLSC